RLHYVDTVSFNYTIPGTHALNVAIPTNWRIMNNTGSSLIVSELIDIGTNFGTSAFNTSGWPVTIAHGDHLDFSATFTPTSLGNEEEGGFNADWRVEDDGGTTILHPGVVIENVVESASGGGWSTSADRRPSRSGGGSGWS